MYRHAAPTPPVARLLAGLIVALALVGCQGVPVAKIEAGVTAVEEVNPDPTGRASPIRVVLYELTALSPFDGSDFFALYDRARETLGSTLLVSEVLQFTPGESRTIRRTMKPGAGFLGVVAAYRDVDATRWRASVATPPGRTTRIEIVVGPAAVTIGPATP